MKKGVLIAIICILIIIAFFVIYSLIFGEKFSNYKLINIEGGDFVESAGYYEGNLYFQNLETGEEYSIFTCSESWDWVVKEDCYSINKADVEKNIEEHKFSSALSGCYVGTLNKCE